MKRSLLLLLIMLMLRSAFTQVRISVPIVLENYGAYNMGSTNLKAGVKYQGFEANIYGGLNGGFEGWGIQVRFFFPQLNRNWNPFLSMRAGEGIRRGLFTVGPSGYSVTRHNTIALTSGIQANIFDRFFVFADYGVSKFMAHNLDRTPLAGGWSAWYSKPLRHAASGGIGYYLGGKGPVFASDSVNRHPRRPASLGMNYMHTWGKYGTTEPMLYPHAELPLSPRLRAEAGVNILMNVYPTWVDGFGVEPRWGGLRLGLHYVPYSRSGIESHLIARGTWVHYRAHYAPWGEKVGWEVVHKLRFPLTERLRGDIATGYGLRWNVYPTVNGFQEMTYHTWAEAGISYLLGKKTHP